MFLLYCVHNIQKKKTFSFPSTTSNRTQIFVRLTTMILFDESLEKINTEFQIASKQKLTAHEFVLLLLSATLNAKCAHNALLKWHFAGKW